jgi:AcrR family transcriptional regulator
MTKTSGPRVRDRRAEIGRALHRCIEKRGYARTTLAHLAAEAGMAPSHVRYYFAGKEAVLEYYFEFLCHRTLEPIRAIVGATPREWIDSFVSFVFDETPAIRSLLRVVVEMKGLSIHNARMRRAALAFDREMLGVLEKTFEQTELARGLEPRDAAEIAYALVYGLLSRLPFDERSGLARSRELFRGSLLRLAGLDPEQA